jgi:hypothetical protein
MANSGKFPISRRTMLRGTGVALALPWLEAMRTERLLAAPADPEPAPSRLGVLFMPNGVRQDQWTPEGTGREHKLSDTLQPLECFRDQLLVLTNLWNRNSQPGDGHYVKTAGILTGTTINKTVGVDLNCNGVSMDQVAAQHFGRHTPLPSLELGTEPVQTGVDLVVGYTRVYGAHIAWRGPTKPLAKEINPRLAYQRLMRAGTMGEQSARQDRRLLDLVIEDARRFRGQLGTQDRQRMDEYLESVNSLEQRLERVENSPGTPWRPRAPLDGFDAPPDNFPPERQRGRWGGGGRRRRDQSETDAAVASQHADYVRLMLDIMVMAFQTDLTRVSTFMFGNSVSNINFSFLDGVSGAHHSLSHHQNDEDKLQQYQRIARWHIEQMAYFMQRLADIPEGDGNLLDNTFVLWASDLRDGNRHDPRNLPVLVGGGSQLIETGQHLSYPRDTPLCNLYVSMLQAMGIPIHQFADSTGPLPGVVARC